MRFVVRKLGVKNLGKISFVPLVLLLQELVLLRSYIRGLSGSLVVMRRKKRKKIVKKNQSQKKRKKADFGIVGFERL